MWKRIAAAATIAALVPASLLAVGGTITDGAVSFTRKTFGSLPTVDLTGVSSSPATDYLFALGWWLRLAGGSLEVPFGNPDTESYVGDSSNLVWDDVSGVVGLRAVEVSTVFDTSGLGSPSGYIQIFLQLQNQSDNEYQIRVFHYADLDIDGAGSDSAFFAEKTPNEVIEVVEGVHFAEYLAAVKGYFLSGQVLHQVVAWPSLLDKLNDAAATTLNGSGLPFAPEDFTGVYEFSSSLPAHTSANLVVIVAANVRIRCSFPQGIFCDGFETGDKTVWGN